MAFSVPKQVTGGGAVLLAILIAASVSMGLPENVHYLWAFLSLVWGLLALQNP
ncbi:MAG: hypothetical protein ACT4PT_05530 [Methanobacteriota archaeon]